MATSAWLSFRARLPGQGRDHFTPESIIAFVDGKTLGARWLTCAFHSSNVAALIQRSVLTWLQLGFGVISESRYAPARRADERRKANAYLRAELEVVPDWETANDDDVVEADDMDAEHRHIEAWPMRSHGGLGEIGELVALEPLPRERENARLEGISLRIRVEGDELLGYQLPEHVETGARHQPQFARDGLKPQRRGAFPSSARPPPRADGGRLALLHGPGEFAVRRHGCFG